MIGYLFIYTLAVYGISSAIVYYNGPFNIIDIVRKNVGKIHPTFEELLSCMFCLPTNVGVILSVISCLTGFYFTPFTLAFHNISWGWILSIILDGAYAGGICSFLNTIETRLNREDDRG